MSIERVIQAAQSRRLHREQAREQARASFLALDKSDRAELLAEFADVVMADEAPSEPPPTLPPQPQAVEAPVPLRSPKLSKTDQAEELVKARPGITTKEIAVHIKQSPRTAGSTLAQLAKNRGTIKSKDGGWYPVANKASKLYEGSGSKVRDSIIQVMGDNATRGTGDIIRAVLESDPDANKHSINAQIYRMANMDPPMLVKRGDGERGPLWGLAPTETREEFEFGSPAP